MVPYFIERMITKEQITEMVQSHIVDKGLFLVDVNVGKANDIKVLLDSMEGVSIEECVEISRWLSAILEDAGDNFSLEVSSPGLDAPLMIRQQYEKNIGRDVEVIFTDGKKKKGKLLEVSADGILIETTEKQLAGGSQKKKKDVLVKKSCSFDEIKSTKVVITF